MQAFASLKMAVKEKTGGKETNFKQHLDKVFKGRKLSGGIGPPIDLSIVISKLRNDLAHGGPTTHGLGFMFVNRCAALIDELYITRNHYDECAYGRRERDPGAFR
jgi:hypothetical protein